VPACEDWSSELGGQGRPPHAIKQRSIAFPLDATPTLARPRRMPAESHVEFRAVTKSFGDGPVVLDQISFAVQRGDFVSLIGPSGCGKSTALRLLAGLSPITSGDLRIDGRTPEAAAAELAFVFQEPTLLPWLTVARNIEIPQRLRGIAPAERTATIHRVLEMVRLREKETAYPRQLSGGQKMRVSIARALALAPKILLLDEPFGALDEMTREHLNEELLAIREQERWTAFFVTHSVAEAVFLSNRIMIMAAGPGRIHTEVPVPLAYPRTEVTRLSREYHDLVAHVSRVLRSVENAAV
jgi:NitT/TauT family transport system ATP-binding protein